jgi:hypothetical protein
MVVPSDRCSMMTSINPRPEHSTSRRASWPVVSTHHLLLIHRRSHHQGKECQVVGLLIYPVRSLTAQNYSLFATISSLLEGITVTRIQHPCRHIPNTPICYLQSLLNEYRDQLKPRGCRQDEYQIIELPLVRTSTDIVALVDRATRRRGYDVYLLLSALPSR